MRHRTRAADRPAAARYRDRIARHAVTGAVVVLGLWLAAGWVAGTTAADWAAGLAAGAAAAVIAPEALRGPAERWARQAGISARAWLTRPLPRLPRPARTPIHDTAEHQRGI